MKKAIATIETEIGIMTIYYNGEEEPLTAEKDDIIEEIEYTPESYEDALDAIDSMYKNGWGLEWIEE